MDFEHFKSLLNKITKVGSFSLAVINLVTKVLVFNLEEIHHWKDLSIIGDEGLTNGVGAGN